MCAGPMFQLNHFQIKNQLRQAYDKGFLTSQLTDPHCRSLTKVALYLQNSNLEKPNTKNYCHEIILKVSNTINNTTDGLLEFRVQGQGDSLKWNSKGGARVFSGTTQHTCRKYSQYFLAWKTCFCSWKSCCREKIYNLKMYLN